MRVALVLGLLVVSTSAFAEPAPVSAPSAASEPLPHFLIGVGVGASAPLTVSGPVAEAGVRLAGPLWLHGTIASVGFHDTMADPGARVVRGGLELQAGAPGNVYLLGVDAGVIEGMSLVSARTGFDLGRGAIHLRLCAELELLDSDALLFGGTATLAFGR